ncbi:ribosome hibernation-promoting factor, HPF/YfiA family [Paenibacillus contaminans]|jgi:putative sigma-54 modulation protein|uniref:Ribosome hibernation promoting factor n=1 Tax=Paenibacillus contaminans TaxID=450362 RepID=A0A329MBE9_9BACL|nr:ribosome-associated translation inhibitor RaiA [Paenibacillus contaminans]RAV17409.1 ribosome-associated translation inhibitor RaiA [Paenibacillus contaminans]
MKFNIRGENIEVTAALRDYVERKLSRLERYFEAPLTSEVHVTLSVVREMNNIEVTIPLTGVLLRAEERASDMYASIDLVVDKLERQIRKHKTKVNRKIRQETGHKAFFKVEGIPAHLLDDEDDLELVRTKSFTLKPMDVEEAILQMNMVGHNFFVFANSDTEQVNVVYKRNDGKYGLIEPSLH